jgi:hypothetical protein
LLMSYYSYNFSLNCSSTIFVGSPSLRIGNLQPPNPKSESLRSAPRGSRSPCISQ